MGVTCDTMQEGYFSLLSTIHNFGVREVNARTGVGCTAVPGMSLRLDLGGGRLPVPGNRRYYPHVAAAEVAWQLMGTRDPEFIMQHAPKVWGDFVEDGELKTAYGYRWRHHFGRDQLDQAVEELQLNPTNRQLVVMAWDPSVDGLGGPQPKNVPCPIGFTVCAINRRVHMSVFLRSSDAFVGLPYDVMGYALMLDAIAATACMTPGVLHFTMANVHAYDPHLQALEDCVGPKGKQRSWAVDVEPILPCCTIQEIVAEPGFYVERMKRLASRVNRPEWDPKPILVV